VQIVWIKETDTPVERMQKDDAVGERKNNQILLSNRRQSTGESDRAAMGSSYAGNGHFTRHIRMKKNVVNKRAQTSHN
jgi:hypothetical protein